jgi:hypothetical protein
LDGKGRDNSQIFKENLENLGNSGFENPETPLERTQGGTTHFLTEWDLALNSISQISIYPE